jgi:phospholipid/cholesterol/gamma-HCH transport system permease protein
MNSIPEDRPSRLEVAQDASGVTMRFSGRLDANGIAPLWNNVVRPSRRNMSAALTLDLTAVTAIDTAGAAMLLFAERTHGGTVTISGATKAFTAVLDLVRPAALPSPPRAGGPQQSWRAVFTSTLAAGSDAVAAIGEVAMAFLRLPSRARMFRRADLLRITDETGVQAVPLVLLIGGLIGIILAFQSLVPMHRFGADLYVANVVAVGLVRELGPLLTAVVLSGRSASAFAAEIGTMKVNQELDALATMGVDVTTMLVLPRLLASVLVMPVLTVLMEVAGLLGMTLVLAVNGLPPITVAHEVAYAVVPADFFGGLFKAALFGAAIAAIGCRRGLTTGVGPRAVGLSATSAVVGGIVSAILLDGLMAVLFFRLKL